MARATGPSLIAPSLAAPSLAVPVPCERRSFFLYIFSGSQIMYKNVERPTSAPVSAASRTANRAAGRAASRPSLQGGA